MTLVEMLERNARELPDKVALIYKDLKLTYRELNAQVNRLAHALLDLGAQKGDRLGFILPRVPELIITFLAGAKVQGVVAPLNYELTRKETTDILQNLRPRFLVVHESFVSLGHEAMPPGLEVKIIVTGRGGPGGDLLWEEIVKNQALHNPSLEVKDDDVVYLNYTSGSTGKAKGALTTHAHIFWNTRSAVETLELTPADVHLCLFAPFAHPHEFLARPLYLGGTLVLLDTIRPKSIAKTIEDHQVTCFMGLAPLFMTLLEGAAAGKFDLGSLRVPESGGMHTPVELIHKFEARFGVPIYAVWGSTETTGIAIANVPGRQVVYGSMGKPCKYYEVKVVGEDGRELLSQEIGELIFRGPGVVSSYYERDADHYNSFKNGWYYSGDLGKRDEDGNFYFIDRKSGMLKVAGHQVYPLEIELKLMLHPDIREAAVIGISDDLRGEVPKAIVVSNDGIMLDKREIIRYCMEEMAHYKVPREVEFREELPKIGSGKINKKALKL